MIDILLKNYRKKHSVSQKFMSETLGLTRVGYISIENGMSVPSKPVGLKIKEFLRLTDYSYEELRAYAAISVEINKLKRLSDNKNKIKDTIQSIVSNKV